MLKYLLLSLIFLQACTDATIASFNSLGTPANIECYSGGKLIFKGRSTGKIETVQNSDGWQFKDAETGKFIRVSGPCVIRN